MNEEIIQGGCILLARQILSSGIWRKPPEYLKIFIYILLKVNHKDNKLFPRGSNFFNFTTELDEISGVTKNQVYDFLRWAKSEKADLLTTQKTTRGVVIKVNNYDTYQEMENYKLQHKFQDSSNTAPTQLQNDSNTINNNERMKECNNNIFIKPTLAEVTQYCLERKNNIDSEKFINFYAAKGWMIGKSPMKDWKCCVHTWEQKDKPKKGGGKWEV
jgi:hypothetical protein